MAYYDRRCLRLHARFALLLAFCLPLAAQITPPSAVRAKVREYRQQHEAEIIRNFADLLAIPNVATDAANIGRNAERISSLLQARGVQTQLLSVPGSPSVVYGELRAPGARHTVVWYAHYDGQPVDESQWSTGPWSPTLRDGSPEKSTKEVRLEDIKPPLNPEWRIYARSASDDKAPIQALLTALDALRAANIPLATNVKFFFEGEEEQGSPHLSAIINEYANLLKADAWLLCDGPVHQTRRMQVYFGARGVTDVEMTVYGPMRPLHSGHYGNWAPNPAVSLADLLSRLRDPSARIKIPGFYDAVVPLSASERQALQSIPDVDQQLREELGIAWDESGDLPLASAIMQPALNVRGIETGHVAPKAQNAIPTEARASIDFRLVPNQQPGKVKQMVEQFIGQEGFYVVRQAPDLETRRSHPKIIELNWGQGYPAARTSMDLPVSRAVVRTIEQMVGEPIIRMPMLGGSVPMYLFLDVLKTPVIGVPIVNHDNNQHGANENLRLQNLWDGIGTFAGILAGLEGNWR